MRPFRGADMNEGVVAAAFGRDEAIAIWALKNFTLPMALFLPCAGARRHWADLAAWEARRKKEPQSTEDVNCDRSKRGDRRMARNGNGAAAASELASLFAF